MASNSDGSTHSADSAKRTNAGTDDAGRDRSDGGNSDVRARRLTYDKIGETRDTGDPVYRGEFDDTGSYMDVVFDRRGKCLRVLNVDSQFKGDMSRMLDDLVRQTGFSEVRFTTPLDESDVEHFARETGIDLGAERFELRERVEGFDSVTETFEVPEGDEHCFADESVIDDEGRAVVEREILVGEWDPSRRTDRGNDRGNDDGEGTENGEGVSEHE